MQLRGKHIDDPDLPAFISCSGQAAEVCKSTFAKKLRPEWRELLSTEILTNPKSEIASRVAPPVKFPKDRLGRFP